MRTLVKSMYDFFSVSAVQCNVCLCVCLAVTTFSILTPGNLQFIVLFTQI